MAADCDGLHSLTAPAWAGHLGAGCHTPRTGWQRPGVLRLRWSQQQQRRQQLARRRSPGAYTAMHCVLCASSSTKLTPKLC